MMQEKILVVDDDPNISSVIESILTQEHFSCVTFISPREALTYLETEKPRLFLAVLDIIMPEIDGLALFKAIRKLPHYANLSVLFISGVAHEEQIVSALELGAMDYIVKPVRLNIFLSKIKTIARRYEEAIQSANTVSLGNLDQRSLEELLAFCGNEMLNGFLKIRHPDDRSGIITFSRGLPERILMKDAAGQCIAMDTEAFDELNRWTVGRFIIQRGEPDLQSFKEMTEGVRILGAKDEESVSAAKSAADNSSGSDLQVFYEHLAKTFYRSGRVDGFVVLGEQGEIEYTHPADLRGSQAEELHFRLIGDLLSGLPKDLQYTAVKTDSHFYQVVNRLDIHLMIRSRQKLSRDEIDEILTLI